MNDTPPNYSDRFNESKNWKKLLFNVGKIIQSSELNELQSIISTERNEIGKRIFGESKLISGCEISVVGTNVTCTEGKLFSNNYIHTIPNLDITITEIGTEIIGLNLSTVIITEAEDVDLLNQETTSSAYLKEGSHRLSFDYELTINDTNSIDLVEITDGILTRIINSPQEVLAPVKELLARRTFDESGNYTVEPYDISISELDINDINFYTKFIITVRNGLSYVNGYRSTNINKSLIIDKAIDAISVIDEPETYNVGTIVYELNNNPVREVNNLTAQVTETGISIIHSGVGSSDLIPIEYQPPVSVVQIDGGTYVEGVDFILSGNFIDWSTGGSEPSSGATFSLDLIYIKQLEKSIVNNVDILNETVTRTATNTDSLSNVNCNSLNKISHSGIDYLIDIDYSLDEELGEITWLTANRPPADYVVYYSYWVPTNVGDYVSRDSFVNSSSNPVPDLSPSYLFNSVGSVDYSKEFSFDVTSGDLPNDATLMFCDYGYALPRKDVICTNSDGLVFDIKGTPSKTPLVPNVSNDLMIIAVFLIEPELNPENIVIEYSDIQRLTMQDLRRVVRELNTLRLNQAKILLEQEALDKNTATEKSGLIVDNFKSLQKSDTDHPNFDCTIDFLSEKCYLAQITHKEVLTIDLSSVNTSTIPFLPTKLLFIDGKVIKPYEEIPYLIHSSFSNIISCNPNNIKTIGAKLELNKDGFNLISNDLVRVVEKEGGEKLVPPTIIRNRVTSRRINNSVNNKIPIATQADVTNRPSHFVLTGSWWSRYWRRHNPASIGFNPNVEKISDVGDTLAKIRSTFLSRELSIRDPFSITLTGSNYLPNEESIVLEVDGFRYPMIPSGSTQLGILPGSVKASATGDWEAITTIFENKSNNGIGVHEVKCISLDSGTDGSIGISELNTDPIEKFSSSNVTASKNSYNNRTRVGDEASNAVLTSELTQDASSITSQNCVECTDKIAPIAQSFVVDKPVYISSVELFFIERDAVEGVEVTIQTIENGFPSGIILAESFVISANIQDDITGNTSTKFLFKFPALVSSTETYCIVIKSNSGNNKIANSTIGELDTNSIPVKDASFTGTLFTSSSLKTWNIDENSDLKVIINIADFSNAQDNLYLEFDPINLPSNFTRFELEDGSELISNSTSLIWEYSDDGGNTWIECSPPLESITNSTNEYRFRVRLSGTDLLTPIIYNNITLHAYAWKTLGYYVINPIVFDSAVFRYVDIYVVETKPVGTTITPEIELDFNSSWIPATFSDEKDLGNDEFERHYTYDSGSDATLHSSAQLRIKLESSNDNSPEISDVIVITRTI